MCAVAELRAVNMRSSHQFEEEIGAVSSENRFFIAKMEFSLRTPRFGRHSKLNAGDPVDMRANV
jgi:hypothetical protein